MNKDKKIQSVIEQYKTYIDTSNSDICHSVKGVWFYYTYDSKNSIYESFYQFSTAEELEKIITGEIIDTINIAIECTAEEIVYVNNKQMTVDVDIIPIEYDFSDRLKELYNNINAVNNTLYLIEEACKAIHSIVEGINH